PSGVGAGGSGGKRYRCARGRAALVYSLALTPLDIGELSVPIAVQDRCPERPSVRIACDRSREVRRAVRVTCRVDGVGRDTRPVVRWGGGGRRRDGSRRGREHGDRNCSHLVHSGSFRVTTLRPWTSRREAELIHDVLSRLPTDLLRTRRSVLREVFV